MSFPNFRMPTISSVVGDMDQPLNHGPTTEEEVGKWDVETVPREVNVGDDLQGSIAMA